MTKNKKILCFLILPLMAVFLAVPALAQDYGLKADFAGKKIGWDDVIRENFLTLTCANDDCDDLEVYDVHVRGPQVNYHLAPPLILHQQTDKIIIALKRDLTISAPEGGSIFTISAMTSKGNFSRSFQITKDVTRPTASIVFEDNDKIRIAVDKDNSYISVMKLDAPSKGLVQEAFLAILPESDKAALFEFNFPAGEDKKNFAFYIRDEFGNINRITSSETSNEEFDAALRAVRDGEEKPSGKEGEGAGIDNPPGCELRIHLLAPYSPTHDPNGSWANVALLELRQSLNRGGPVIEAELTRHGYPLTDFIKDANITEQLLPVNAAQMTSLGLTYETHNGITISKISNIQIENYRPFVQPGAILMVVADRIEGPHVCGEAHPREAVAFVEKNFSTANGSCYLESLLQGETYNYDVVVLHEIFHLLGLGHFETEWENLMFPSSVGTKLTKVAAKIALARRCSPATQVRNMDYMNLLATEFDYVCDNGMLEEHTGVQFILPSGQIQHIEASKEECESHEIFVQACESDDSHPPDLDDHLVCSNTCKCVDTRPAGINVPYNTPGGEPGESSEEEEEDCPNGVVDPGEECDDGNWDDNDDCTTSCTLTECGDGVTQSASTRLEECDDGNNVDNDECNNDCKLTGCGNGVVEVPNANGDNEECEAPGDPVPFAVCQYGGMHWGWYFCSATCQYPRVHHPPDPDPPSECGTPGSPTYCSPPGSYCSNPPAGGSGSGTCNSNCECVDNCVGGDGGCG